MAYKTKKLKPTKSKANNSSKKLKSNKRKPLFVTLLAVIIVSIAGAAFYNFSRAGTHQMDAPLSASQIQGYLFATNAPDSLGFLDGAPEQHRLSTAKDSSPATPYKVTNFAFVWSDSNNFATYESVVRVILSGRYRGKCMASHASSSEIRGDKFFARVPVFDCSIIPLLGRQAERCYMPATKEVAIGAGPNRANWNYKNINGELEVALCAAVVADEDDSSNPDPSDPNPVLPPEPEPPKCANGNIIRPDRHCDDGGWSIVFNEDWAGRRWEVWKNGSTCGTRAEPGYMYHFNCSDIEKIKGFIEANKNNDRARKAYPLQDTYPLKGGTFNPLNDTNPELAYFSVRTGNFSTQSQWEKPRKDAKYLGPPRWFMPDPHGLDTRNPDDPTNNFYGNIWGYLDGKMVAASNMDSYTNANREFPMLYGPFENPKGGMWQASAGGRRHMKVCWEMKRIGGNGAVSVSVYSNYSFFKYLDKARFDLGPGGFKEYCKYGIKVDPNALNMEYPVFYHSGGVAIAGITREFYWPSEEYTLYLPNKEKFGKNDPYVKQPDTKFNADQQCISGGNSSKGQQNSCKLSADQPLTISTSMFEAAPGSLGKQICFNINNLSAEADTAVEVFGKGKTTPAANFKLYETAPDTHCTLPSDAEKTGRFYTLVLRSNQSEDADIKVKSVTVTPVSRKQQ